jgi:aryl-alcohol dehydrogenase-like predicted oxidoreductase
MGREVIDLIQLHNHLGFQREIEKNRVSLEDFEAVIRACETLQRQGKVRFWGITGMGPTGALSEAVAKGGFQTVQVPYNLLNQSAGQPAPAGFAFQDYGRLIDQAARREMGVLAIRVLAGGALSGSVDRHPVASNYVNPIASESFYSADVAASRRYEFLVKNGVVQNLVEAAVRFVISKPGVATALLGISSLDQVEQAVQYTERGPLSGDVLEDVRATWSGGE